MGVDRSLAWRSENLVFPVEAPAKADTWLTGRPRTALIAVAGTVLAGLAGALGVHSLRLGVGFVVGVALVITVLLRPAVGGLVLVAAVPALSGLAAGIPIPHVRVSEILIGAIAATVLVSTRRRHAVAWQTLDSVLLIYGAGWLFFGAFNAVMLHQHLGLTDWGTAFGQLQFFLLYRGVRVALRTTAERRRGLRVLLGASIPVAVLAILQQIHAPAVGGFILRITGGPDQSGATGSLQRATGPFDNWAALAGYLVPVLLVIASLLLSGQIRRHRRAAWVVTGFAVIGLLLTAELSAIACVVIGTAVMAGQYGLFRRVRRDVLVVVVVVLAALIGIFLAQRLSDQFSQNATHRSAVPQTISYRAGIWTSQYIPAIDQRPLEGYGVQLPASIRWPYPESQYIADLIDGGLPLLMLFSLLMWAMVAQGRRISRSDDPFDVALGRSLTVVTVVLIAMDVVWPYISNGGLPQMLWCVFALASPVARTASSFPAVPHESSVPC